MLVSVAGVENACADDNVISSLNCISCKCFKDFIRYRTKIVVDSEDVHSLEDVFMGQNAVGRD